MNKRLKVLELFGGIGAPRKALLNLGVDHKALDYVEIDERAVRTYNALYPHHHYPTDIVGYNSFPDFLIHSSPCQDFSRSGKRWGGDSEDKTRSSLMWETLRILKEYPLNHRPKYVVWENVKGVLDKDMKHTFHKYLDEMERIGYTNNYEVLNSIDFGVPQNRNRVFVVSILGGRVFNFDNIERKPMKPLSMYLEKEVDEKYTITSPSMLRNIEGSSTFVPPSETKFKGRIKVLQTEDNMDANCIPYSQTITCKQQRSPNSGVIKISSDKYRILTEMETMRLMGYSDNEVARAESAHPTRPGCLNGTLYHQAGNSIVVDVLESIFKELLKEELNASEDKQLSLEELLI